MTRQALCAALGLSIALLLLRCTPLPPPIDPDPPGPEPPPVPDCASAGARLEALQCLTEAGDPLWVSPLGETFAERCEKELAKGVEWRVDCLSLIESCGQVDAATKGEWCGP